MLMLKLVTSGLGELDRIKAFVTSGAARLRIAETLTALAKPSSSKLAIAYSKNVLTSFPRWQRLRRRNDRHLSA
jgi:hypothetical protein